MTGMAVPERRGRPAVLVCLLAGLALAAPTMAQEAPPQAYRGLEAVAIPYANGPIRLDHVPEIWLRLPGSAARRFGMDTGSTGIVVSAEHYVPAAGDVEGGPGTLTYNSSGRVLHGTYWTTDVEIMQGPERPAAVVAAEERLTR